MATWIFQGNPKIFDIDDYVSRYPELIYWRTPRYAKKIAIGDRVFLWRSGQNSGAIAIGSVVEAPTLGSQVKHPEALGIDLWRAEAPDPHELKTGVHLQDIRLTKADNYVPRNAVKSDAHLNRSTIITAPNGTIFLLNDAEATALERLWALPDHISGASSVDSASEGASRLRSHFQRERSSLLREKKLTEVRAVHGKCICEICGIDEAASYPDPFGKRIFEVHHRKPLFTAATPIRTTLADLAVLCANCHRAVHATTAVEENFNLLTLSRRSNK